MQFTVENITFISHLSILFIIIIIVFFIIILVYYFGCKYFLLKNMLMCREFTTQL